MLRRGSVHRRIAAAAAVVGVFAFATKLCGAAKDIVVAHQFGVSDQVDAFALALTVPAFAITLIGGSIESALLPVYVDVRHREGHAAAQRLLSSVVVLSTVLLVAVSCVIAALVPSLLPRLSSRFTPDKVRLTAQLAYLLIPIVLVAGSSTTWTAVLNAHERFAAPAAAGLAIPISSIVFLLAFGARIGIRALAAGAVVGYCVEALVIARAIRSEGLSLVPRWGGITPGVRRVVAQFAPGFAGALVMGVNPVVDSMMAASLDPGSVASLNYGNKIVAFAMGIGSLSLGAAVFPHFSKLASERDWQGLARSIRNYGLVLLAILVPITIACVWLSQPIVRIVFQRGAFTPTDTVRVALVQALFLIQVPFYLPSLLFVRFLSAIEANRVLMWGSVVSCVANVAGNVILSRYLGAAGIALSTSVVYALAFAFLGWSTWQRLAALKASRSVNRELGSAAARP